MFPNYYNEKVVLLIHKLSDDKDKYFVTTKQALEFDKLITKLLNLLEEVSNGSND